MVDKSAGKHWPIGTMFAVSGPFYPQNWKAAPQSLEDLDEEELYDFYYDDLEIRYKKFV
jgi:hypothetical protein